MGEVVRHAVIEHSPAPERFTGRIQYIPGEGPSIDRGMRPIPSANALDGSIYLNRRSTIEAPASWKSPRKFPGGTRYGPTRPQQKIHAKRRSTFPAPPAAAEFPSILGSFVCLSCAAQASLQGRPRPSVRRGGSGINGGEDRPLRIPEVQRALPATGSETRTRFVPPVYKTASSN